MTQPAAEDRYLSVDEYLAMEEGATVRHEYVAGLVYAMTGATLRHNIIVGNIVARLREGAARGPCRVFFTDGKVRAANDVFYYPDLVVACGALDQQAVYVHDPCMVIEVIAPSTARIDRSEKLLAYREMPSLRAYLIVEQRRRRVDVHLREEGGEWRHELIIDSGKISVPCPARTLTLDEIYQGVALSMVSEPEPIPYDTAAFAVQQYDEPYEE